MKDKLNTQTLIRPKPETLGPKPILAARFSEIRKKPAVNPTVEDFSDIFSDKQYREHSFEEARKAFEFILDKKKFVHHIKEKENEESFSYLKEVRRYGLILRALYRFIDSGHKCAENLQQFLSLLGKYNDRYWISPSEEIREEVIKDLEKIEFPVNYVDTLEFKKYTASILFDIEQLLEEKILSVEKFHGLRQKIRFFADIMQVAAAENYKGNLHWLFYSMIELSVEMGKHHDDLVQKGLNGEIDYHQSTVEVNPHTVSEFKKLKPFLEKVFGLV